LACLWFSAGALGATYHHWRREVVADDDIRYFATEEPRVARLRGEIVSEPIPVRGQPGGELRGFPSPDSTRAVLLVTELQIDGVWRPVSGHAQLSVPELKTELFIGSRIEATGQLMLPPAAANPGEFDYASYLRDQGIGATFIVRKTSDSIWLRGEAGWALAIVLARIRQWGRETLQASLPESEAALGSALLLGDDAALSREEWEKYIETGVIHIVAISGQHLAVLSAFAFMVMRLLGASRRPR